jgi:hypothetical protein
MDVSPAIDAGSLPGKWNLRRADTANLINEHLGIGLLSEAALARLAHRGDGPPFRKFGGRCFYELESALEWAKSRFTPIVRSTAELRAEHHTA